MTNIPNIFDYATSELSQDAALCYFLAYGAPSFNSEKSKAAHDFAIILLKAIFEACGTPFPDDVTRVVVKKQLPIKGKYLDILVEINDFFIAIEDKRQAQDHSGQLSVYSKLHELLNVPAEKVLLTYIQTGNQANIAAVEAANFKLIRRSVLLDLLDTDIGKTIRRAQKIYDDFFIHFSELEHQYLNFAQTDVTKWRDSAHVGFVEALIAENHGHWLPAGGGGGAFKAYRSPIVDIAEASAYLQVEVSNNNQEPQIHLRFKIDVPLLQNKEMYVLTWQKWHDLMMKAVDKSQSKLPIKKPHRATPRQFGKEKTLSHGLLVAKIDDGQNWSETRVFPTIDANKHINFSATVATLTHCQAILEFLRTEALSEQGI